MAKLPQNRYPLARAMLEALDTYVQNPSVLFEYQYIRSSQGRPKRW